MSAISLSDRWALAYYVLSLSAFKDPLTGKPLPISAADRRALNDTALKAPTSAKAYALQKPRQNVPKYGGTAWASRKGIEIVPNHASAVQGTLRQPK